MEIMTFTKAIATCFKKSFDFSSRARRSEYWYFLLFNSLVSIVAFIIAQGRFIHPVPIIAFVILCFPSWAVLVRRLHDIGKSGFFALLPLPGYILSIFGFLTTAIVIIITTAFMDIMKVTIGL